jgi:hypothetical protein
MDKKNKKARVIAYYLPQFHPIPENDAWWGKGFTEWTNVGKARRYFPGHYQPRIPADLGYYDLRLPEVREAQAELAKEAGISAFCYWHYWFGNGKQLLEMPLREVVRTGKPDFQFCLGWANHSWINKDWHRVKNNDKEYLIKRVLIEQKYPGKKDIDDHFYKMLPVFRDKRYFKIHEKHVFIIYKVNEIPDFSYFKDRWDILARENGLPGFFFVANSENVADLNNPSFKLCDAIALCRIQAPIQGKNLFIGRAIRFVLRHIFSIVRFSVTTVNYAKAIKRLDTPFFNNDRIYPALIPNWDPSPRRGPTTTIYKNSTPALFKKHVMQTLSHLENKNDEDKIVFLKSWNEWAEGNYMEPDLKWGKGYINALREALEDIPINISWGGGGGGAARAPPPPPPRPCMVSDEWVQGFKKAQRRRMTREIQA